MSVPLLWVGPDDPRTVLLMLPLLMVATAVAVAGIARRLAGPWASIVAGVLLGSFPTVVFATQTYWFGLGAARRPGLAPLGPARVGAAHQPVDLRGRARRRRHAALPAP